MNETIKALVAEHKRYQEEKRRRVSIICATVGFGMFVVFATVFMYLKVIDVTCGS